MANFEIAFKRREPIEGGWSGEAEDDGNWTGAKQGVGYLVGTNRGITAWEYSKFLQHEASIEEMKNMPREHAMQIFKAEYWDKIKGDLIVNQGIANDLYDTAVNQGLITGIKQIQEAAGIASTGKVDELTLKTLNNQA